MVSVLREKFAHLNLTFSIGGQISFDVCDHHDIVNLICQMMGQTVLNLNPLYRFFLKVGIKLTA